MSRTVSKNWHRRIIAPTYCSSLEVAHDVGLPSSWSSGPGHRSCSAAITSASAQIAGKSALPVLVLDLFSVSEPPCYTYSDIRRLQIVEPNIAAPKERRFARIFV